MTRSTALRSDRRPLRHRSRRVRSDLAPMLRLFLASRPRLLLMGAALAMVTVLMGMGLLGLSGWFITATGLAGLQASSAIAFDVFQPSAGIRLLALGRTGARYAERLVTHDATLAVLADLREQLFRGWARPEAARQLLLRPAQLLFRLTADIDALESLYLRVLVPVAAALGAALLAGGVLGFLNFWLGAVLALWLLTTGGAIAWAVARRAQPAAVRRARGMEALRAQAVDLVAGQTELAMAGRLGAQCQAVASADQRLARADDMLNLLEVRAGFAYGVVGTLTLVGVLAAVGALAGQGVLSAPAAALALLLALTATEPFAALRRGALEAGRTLLAARRLAPKMQKQKDLMALPAQLPPPEAPSLSAAQPAPASAVVPALADGLALDLQGVTLAHAGSPVAVFTHLSLRVQAGERVAVVGASGAGKSTLLAAIAGELAPLQGNVQALPCCLLTQRTELFQDSLRENLRLADPAASDDRLWQVLQAAGLAADVQALAAGLDTRLGEGGLGLSGGQSRRLALARLLLLDTPLWLLDEPTEALDAHTADDVLQHLAQAAAGRTLLVSTHLRREAALADRVVCVKEGRTVADVQRGTPAFDAVLQTLRAD